MSDDQGVASASTRSDRVRFRRVGGWTWHRLAGACWLILTAVVTAVAVPAVAAPSDRSGVMPSASACQRVDGDLNGVAAVSAGNAWAAGYTPSVGVDISLIEHWDGKGWRQVLRPKPAANVVFYGVAAAGPDNVWVVGNEMLHWNGRTWRKVGTRGLGRFSLPRAVDIVSARDAWTVGGAGAGGKTLIARWNGSAWHRIPSPASGGVLDAVAALGARDAWAVGNTNGGHLLIEHWNGRTWRLARAPSTTAFSNLNGVAIISANDAWAAGNDGKGRTLILHWNGAAWKRVPSPSPRLAASLYGVTATSARNAWAVGWYVAPGGWNQPVILRWNGRSWRQTGPQPHGAELYDVAASSSRKAWAVGDCALTWNGRRWS